MMLLAMYGGMAGHYVWRREYDRMDQFWRERFDALEKRERMWQDLALRATGGAREALSVATDVLHAKRTD